MTVIHHPATSSSAASTFFSTRQRTSEYGANYALQVGPDLWMPFDVADHQWANERFAGRTCGPGTASR